MQIDHIVDRVKASILELQDLDIADRHISGYLSAKADCVPIGAPSHFAAMVAEPLDNPNVIVKVTRNPEDGFIVYALMSLMGLFPEEHYMKVYAAVQVHDMWIFVTEKLHETQPDDRTTALKRGAADELRHRGAQFCSKLAIDLHFGNFMERADGTVVISDPYGYCTFEVVDGVLQEYTESTDCTEPDCEVGVYWHPSWLHQMRAILGRPLRQCTPLKPVHPVIPGKPHLQNPVFVNAVQAHARVGQRFV